MTQEQLPTAARDQVTPTRDTGEQSAVGSVPANPVPLAVVRTQAPPGGAEPGGPLGRLRRSVAGTGVGIIRRDPTTTTPAPTPPDWTTLIPKTGTTYDLPTAIAELKKYHPSQKDATKFSNNGRKNIAKAWGQYILDTHLSSLKPGSVRDTYKSSHDHGHADEFSVSQNIDGISDIVIHAHMDEHGNAKPGNGVHWKWSDKELLAETYQMTAPQVTKLLDPATAKSSWLTKISLPTVGGTGTPTPTTAPPTTPPVTSTVVPSLPTT